MNKIIIGNIISFIGCIMFFISCRLKKQKQICMVQSIECMITGTGALVLDGFMGAIITYICGIRNFLGIWKLNGKICVICCLLACGIVTSLSYNNIWDIIPFIATFVYTIFLSFKSAKITKLGTIPNASLWFIYCFHIGAYVNCIFNIINILFCIKDLYKKNYDD